MEAFLVHTCDGRRLTIKASAATRRSHQWFFVDEENGTQQTVLTLPEREVARAFVQRRAPTGESVRVPACRDVGLLPG